MISGGLRGVKEWHQALESVPSNEIEAQAQSPLTMEIAYRAGWSEIIFGGDRVTGVPFSCVRANYLRDERGIRDPAGHLCYFLLVRLSNRSSSV